MSKRHLTQREIAQVLFEAQYATSDRVVAERWGIGVRTITRYRQRMKNDQNLAKLVNEMAAAIQNASLAETVNWIKEADEVFVSAMKRMKELIPECDKVSELMEVCQVFGEIAISKLVLIDDESDRESGAVKVTQSQAP